MPHHARGRRPYLTSGKTLDATWDTYSQAYTDLANATALWARVYCTLSSTDWGAIVESGAQANGLCLYALDGVLYFQCGDGSVINAADIPADTDRAEVSWAITKDDPVIEIYCDTTKAELYIDGELVDSDTYSSTKIAGGDEGDIGGSQGPANNTIPWTRLGVLSGATYTGTVQRVEFFDVAF